MALSLTLDPAEKVLAEAGFHQHLSAFELIRMSQAGDPTSPLWAAPDTGVIMLRPQQISPNWLNSADQVASVIRITDLVVSATDAGNKTIFEELGFGNVNNPYIYHAPVGFPGTPSAGPPLPGSPPSIVGAPIGGNIGPGLVTISNETEVPFSTYSAPDAPVGSIADGRVLCYTKDPLPANAALYFRWYGPDPRIGHETRYMFFVGQLAIEVLNDVVMIHTDVSAHGDRSAFSRIFSKTLFNPGDFSPGTEFSWLSTLRSADSLPQDRGLLFIPYFRNRVLLVASNGAAISVKVKETPVPAKVGDDHAWEITRSDILAVWCITPAPGRFQLQRVRYANGPSTLQLPFVKIDYTPVNPPTVTAFKDEEHGTSINGTVSDPPNYSLRFNDLNACPPATTGAGDQSRTYGVTLTFNGEATHRWTPFFYGLTFDAPSTLADVTTTPTTVGDLGGTVSLQNALVAWGDRPGDGRAEVNLLDFPPTYPLASYYYRTELPLKLVQDGTTAFFGRTDRIITHPFGETNRVRSVQMIAVDRWKQLSRQPLRDQANKYGQGHISVVLDVVRQAGIDTTAAETPPLNATYNTPLGGLDSSIPYTEEQAKQVRAMWDPRPDDTAASYVTRIAELFSGWDIGFRGTGEFFYLPKDYQATVSLRFFHSAAERAAAAVIDPTVANNPLVRSPVEFDPQPPEANVVVVFGASDSQGKVLQSSVWIDWASLKNPLAVNYLGYWKAETPRLPWALSCAELNRVARNVFQEVRRRRRRISFESDFIPTLKIGQILEVGTYGQARLKSVKAEYINGSWNPATYECEIVEAGYNT